MRCPLSPSGGLCNLAVSCTTTAQLRDGTGATRGSVTARLEAIDDDATDYAHAGYAASLAEFGEPVFLPRSGGWILRRRIDGSPFSDAMGPYPLFFCPNWSGLGEDLSELAAELVQYFSGRVRWVDLAGTSGISTRGGDCLAAFKSGWSTGTMPAYLCERILQPETYEALARRAPHSRARYFPAYRAGEFG